MINNQLLLSIVIANYNQGKYIETAIKSILAQGVVQTGVAELIIVDGASTDESVSVIRKYESYLSWWVSERDDGQSAAFNKGFRRARGRYLTWLNADDAYIAGALSTVTEQMRLHSDCEWFTGNHLRFVEPDKVVIQVEWGPHCHPMWLQHKNSPIVVFGPTTFFSKRIYDLVGGVDERFHKAMDTDLWIRFQAAGIKQRRINCFCWAFRMHRGSKTAEFVGHRVVSVGPGTQLANERRASAEKVGYRPSMLLRIISLIGRVIDGSLVRRHFLRKRLLGKCFQLESFMVDRGA